MSFPTIAVQFYYSSAWNDLGTYCVGFTIDRGRTKLLERHKAGTLVLVMDNSDGTFDPANNTNLKADTPVRVRATSASGSVFQVAAGTIDDFEIAWDGPDSSTTTIRCTDNFKILARVPYDASTAAFPPTAGDTCASALDTMLTAAYAGTDFGSLHASNSRGTIQDLSTLTAANLLEVAQLIAEQQNGEFFASTWNMGSSTATVGDGAAFRLQGFEARWRASVATFSDAPGVGEWPYDTSQLRGFTDDDLLINSVSVTRLGGVAQTASDGTSQNSHGVRPYALTGTYAEGDMQSLELAEHLVTYRSEPGVMGVAPIALEPDIIDTNAFWDLVLGCCTAAGNVLSSPAEGVIDFGSRVTVEKTPPYGSPLVREVFVTGLIHEVANVDGSQRWRTTLVAADASQYPTTTLILDDATTGLLDGSRTWG